MVLRTFAGLPARASDPPRQSVFSFPRGAASTVASQGMKAFVGSGGEWGEETHLDDMTCLFDHESFVGIRLPSVVVVLETTIDATLCQSPHVLLISRL